MSVTVPAEFADIGYSGLFHLEVPITGTPADVERLRSEVPFLMTQRGWMALKVVEVADGPRMVVVRRDSDAICDLVLRPRSWRTT